MNEKVCLKFLIFMICKSIWRINKLSPFHDFFLSFLNKFSKGLAEIKKIIYNWCIPKIKGR